MSSLVLAFAAGFALQVFSVNFLLPSAPQRAPAVARRSFETGKVNVGTEISGKPSAPPQPVLECDEGCMTAIMDCIEDGCSIEALATLDKKLADDESIIADTVAELKTSQKTAYSQENAGTLAWMGNFLSRSSSLRAQLQALRGVSDSDFVKQMVKAASVAFGGGRPNDYPKVGVSAYSA